MNHFDGRSYCDDILENLVRSASFNVILACLVVGTATTVAADEVVQDKGQPIAVWENGKNSLDPIHALKQLVGLPNGIVGESKQSLKGRLILSHARIMSEDKNSIVVRGKMKDGGELQVNFSYYFEQDKFIEKPVEIQGTKINK